MADNTVTLVGNLTRDPELRFTPAARPSPPSASPSTAATSRTASGRRRSRSSTSPPGASSARTPPRRSPRAPGSSSPAASSSARRRPRTARSAAWSRSSPTRSARACAGPPPRSTRNDRREAAAEGGGSGGGGAGGGGQQLAVRSAAAGSSTTTPRTRSRSDEGRRMPKTHQEAKPKDSAKKPKKKTSVLVQERVDYVDYKDVNLLQRFMSDRSKIRARRVTGQRRPAAARRRDRRSRTPARWRCCPYTKRVTTQRGGRAVATGVTAAPSSATTVPPRRPRRGPTPARGRPRTARRGARGRRSRRRERDEGDPPRRRRRRRQAGRHRRRVERLRPQLPLPQGLAMMATDGAVAQAGVDAPGP